MEGWNPLIGGPAPEPAGAPSTPAAAPAASETSPLALTSERTEFVVAAIVLGALAVLVLFRVAGFKAVIATRVAVGGGS